jgi:hypothetical protein
MRSTLRSNRHVTRLAGIAAGLVLTAAGCGGDPEDDFRLWSRNEEGFQTMATYVADQSHDTPLRVRALEVLVENKRATQVMRVVDKAPDKPALLAGLVPAMEKGLTHANPETQGQSKKALFEILPGLAADKQAAVRKALGKYAFGDLNPQDSAERVAEKLGQRVNVQEIAALGDDGLPGAELMLSKGIKRDEVMALLQESKTPAAAAALINGLRGYHGLKEGKVKVTEIELGAIQKTDSVEGFLYLIELYQKRIKSTHSDDQAAAKNAIAVAADWWEGGEGNKAKEANRAKVKAAWAQVKPAMEAFLQVNNCDDRWLAAQVLTVGEGVAGVQHVLEKIPNDENYSNGSFATTDVKLQITGWCNDDAKPLGADKLLPVYKKSLQSQRLFERVLAVRCLLALGDDASLEALKAVAADKKDVVNNLAYVDRANPANPKPANDPAKTWAVDAMVVPPKMSKVTIRQLAEVAVDTVAYLRQVDKDLAEGKLDAAAAKKRKLLAGGSFDRKGAALAAFAEGKDK